MKSLLWISLFALLIPSTELMPAFSPTAAAAQGIPVNIPDTPSESPVDRERQKREERHHSKFSRIFLTTSVIASSALNHSALVFDTILEGGVQLNGGDALYLFVGARNAPALGVDGSPQIAGGDASQLVALGYELGLARFSSHPVVARSAVGFTMGGWFGDSRMISLDVSPRYIVRTNPYWSFPVGIKISTAFARGAGVPLTLVGLSMGVRRHFGQRESLE